MRLSVYVTCIASLALCVNNVCVAKKTSMMQKRTQRRIEKRARVCAQNKDPFGIRLMRGTKWVMLDAFDVQVNLFTVSTVKVAVAFAPMYILAKREDRSIHSKFYDERCHKNKPCMNTSFTKAANKLGDISIIVLSSLAFLGTDYKMKTVGRVYAIGAVLALEFKNVVKQAKMKCNIRPFNECFEKKETYGGFPSGHMIEMAYSTTVWGLQYGWKAGVPLGLLSGVMFASLIDSNRHFASQVVAGAGVGVMFGIAADRVINKRLAHDWSLGICSTPRGGVGCKVSHVF